MNESMLEILASIPHPAFEDRSPKGIDKDPSYSRDYHPGRLRLLARTFNLQAAGAPSISERTNGDSFSIDGAHRMKIAIEKGVEKMPFLVYRGLTVNQEAALYTALNDAQNVGPLDKWKARRAFGDPVVVAIDEILAEFDAEISPNEIAAVKAVEGIYLKGGSTLLRSILMVIDEAYGSVSVADNLLLKGMRDFLRKQAGRFEWDRLVTRLNESGHSYLFERAGKIVDGYQGTGEGSRVKAMYLAIIETYNYHLSISRLDAAARQPSDWLESLESLV